MNLIKTPLVLEKNSTVIKYPTSRAMWSNTNVVDGFLVGYFDGALYAADGSTKAFAWEFTEPAQQYKTKGLTPTEFRRLYGFENSLFADRVRDDINGNLSYLEGVNVDSPAVLVGFPNRTYRDVLRTTFVSFYSAPVIDCDDPETIKGLEVHYRTGVLPSESEYHRILRGLPL